MDTMRIIPNDTPGEAVQFDRTMTPRKTSYARPPDVRSASIETLIGCARHVPESQKARLKTKALFAGADEAPGIELFFAGDPSLLAKKCVAVVGSRKVSELGAKRAARLARELAERGIVVMSGLAEGVDYAAHTAAIDSGGSTVGVIGTGVDRAYPASSAALQELIWRKHLLVSPYPPGSPVYRSSFPHRNKVMAALSDATVIVEASDTSGSLHQAAECLRIGRWLFIAQNMIDDPSVTWPREFLASADRGARVRVLRSTDDVVGLIRDGS